MRIADVLERAEARASAAVGPTGAAPEGANAPEKGPQDDPSDPDQSGSQERGKPRTD